MVGILGIFDNNFYVECIAHFNVLLLYNHYKNYGFNLLLFYLLYIFMPYNIGYNKKIKAFYTNVN